MRIIDCPGCNRQAEHDSHNLCKRCAARWRAHGRPPGGPGPVTSYRDTRLATLGRSERAQERMDELKLVLSSRTKADGSPISLREAAKLIGVSTRTAERYSSRLNSQRSGDPLNE